MCEVFAGKIGGNNGTLVMADLSGIPPCRLPWLAAEVIVTLDVPVDTVEGGAGGGVAVTLELAGLSVGGGLRWANLVSKFVMKLSSAVFRDAERAWDIASTVADVSPPPSFPSLSAMLILLFGSFLWLTLSGYFCFPLADGIKL